MDLYNIIGLQNPKNSEGVNLLLFSKRLFEKSNLNRINPTSIRENNIHNLNQVIAYFSDATIIINPKLVIIQIKELISDEVDKSDIDSFNILIGYILKLKQVGLTIDEVTLEEGHWARMQSVFSDFLFEKVDNRYFLQLEDGIKFWIDHSKGTREHESNDKTLIKRVDEAIGSLKDTKSTFYDVDGLITISANILQAQANEFQLVQKNNNNVGWLAENIKRHGPAWFGMAKEAGNIHREVRRLNTILSQRRITEF